MVRENGRHKKKSHFDLSKNHKYTYCSCKESKFSNLLHHYYHEFQQTCSRYTFTW